MRRGGLGITLGVLSVACVFFAGMLGALKGQTTDLARVEASLTSTSSSSATPLPSSTPSQVPTIDALATTAAQSEATTIAASTDRALTQTSIAIATSGALQSEAFAALERERQDAHAIALAQIAELEAKKRIVELTLEPTAVSIRATEDARELWRKIERDRIEDEAHAQLVAQQLEDASNISRAQSVGMIALVAGLPITLVVSLFMLARAQAQKLQAERDRSLAEIAGKNYEAQLEHDLQMRRAEILNRNDLIHRVSRQRTSQIDGRMTRDRLLAFVKAAVLASGPSSTVLTPSTDRVWTSEDVRISHREYSACADELYRLSWIEKPERGKTTSLTERATLGDLLSVLQRSSEDQSAPPVEVEEELEAIS